MLSLKEKSKIKELHKKGEELIAGSMRLLPLLIITSVLTINFGCSGNESHMQGHLDSTATNSTSADSNYFQKSLLSIKGDSIMTTMSEVNARAYVAEKDIKNTEDWHHIENLYVEGTHGRLGGKTTNAMRFTLSDPKNYKYEWGQDVLKKDDDAGWDFNAYTDADIEWTVWAQNCLHSCDEITLQIKFRVVKR